MKKTLSQAAKREQREARNQVASEQRKQEKEETKLLIVHAISSSQTITPVPSTKEKRQLKKQKEQEWHEAFVAPATQAEHSNAQNSTVAAPLPQKELEHLQQKLEEEAQTLTDHTARLAINHSTHCEGLRPFIVKLQKKLGKNTTIIPGALTTTRTHYAEFAFEFDSQKNHVYTFYARRGHTLQEVYISVSEPDSCPVKYIEEQTAHILEHQMARHDTEETPLVGESSPSQVNKATAALSTTLWKTKAKEQSEYQQAQIRSRQKEDQLKLQERKLASKIEPGMDLESTAKRDLAIKSGESRGRYAMK